MCVGHLGKDGTIFQYSDKLKTLFLGYPANLNSWKGYPFWDIVQRGGRGGGGLCAGRRGVV